MNALLVYVTNIVQTSLELTSALVLPDTAWHRTNEFAKILMNVKRRFAVMAVLIPKALFAVPVLLE